MKVVKAAQEGKGEVTVKLSQVGIGNVFRFPFTTFEAAISEKDEETFYMVIGKPAQDHRVSVLSLDGKVLLERDGDRYVIQHRATIHIEPNV